MAREAFARPLYRWTKTHRQQYKWAEKPLSQERINAYVEPQHCPLYLPTPTGTSTSISPGGKNYRLQQFFQKKALGWVLMVWGCRGRHFVSNSIVIWWLALSLLLPIGNVKLVQRNTDPGRSNRHSSPKKRQPWIKWFTWQHPLNVFPKIPQLNWELFYKSKSWRQHSHSHLLPLPPPCKSSPEAQALILQSLKAFVIQWGFPNPDLSTDFQSHIPSHITSGITQNCTHQSLRRLSSPCLLLGIHTNFSKTANQASSFHI